MPGDIFESPAVRSGNTTGTSEIRKSLPVAEVVHLHLKAVAARARSREVHGLQDLPPESFKAGGRVFHGQPEDRPGVEAAALADEAPQERPVLDPAAGHVPGPDRHVRALQLVQKPRQSPPASGRNRRPSGRRTGSRAPAHTGNPPRRRCRAPACRSGAGREPGLRTLQRTGRRAPRSRPGTRRPRPVRPAPRHPLAERV